ncbi:MAG: MBOAT family protein [Nitrospirota bacterium]|nr:MBOAT family protein [Nitrospirota bacterium]
MLFNSLQYLIFFSLVVAVYYSISNRYRWPFLLAASYYFYMCWKIEYVLLIIASTLIAYAAGILLEKHRVSNSGKGIVVAAVLSNLGILFIFKYYNFFNDSLRVVLGGFDIFYGAPALKLLLPVGISFYTFQVVSYLVDVYKGRIKAERHFGYFAVFVSFFPKLVAGPIERAGNLLPQFREELEFDYRRTTDGLKLIAWGLFKKMVIADRLTVYVDQIYNNPAYYSGAPVILATVFFAFQIYCDFSGYSDIAIGSGQVLGFRLMNNFDRPYSAKSVTEFWRHWHISLSTWLTDYIYTPITIRCRDWGIPAIIFSLFVTFLACGLWHGASWTFIIWGLLHGFMLSLDVITKKRRKKFRKMVPAFLYDNISKVLTFSFVCFTYVFFRANSVSDAFLIINNMFLVDFSNLNIEVTFMSRTELVVAFFSIAILEAVQFVQGKINVREYIAEKPLLFRWAIYIAFTSYILFFKTSGAQFIYFQF